MATFEDLARRAQGLTTFAVPMPLAVQWASDRVHELLGKRRVAILKRNLELSLPGAIGQGIALPVPGTITATRGSRIVTGSAAAQTAWLTLPDQFPQGWFMRVRSAWHRIQGKTATTIILESPYAEDDVAAVAYNLVQRYHQLPENVYQLEEGSFVLARTGQSLVFLNETTLTQTYPGRWNTSLGNIGLPACIAEVEPGPGDVRQIEVYPASGLSELITYAAFVLRDDFTYSDALPLGLEVQHVLPGLLADFYGWSAAQAGQDANMQASALNEKARNLTRWEHAKEAALARLETNRLRGFVLARPKRGMLDAGIHDAYAHVWSR